MDPLNIVYSSRYGCQNEIEERYLGDWMVWESAGEVGALRTLLRLPILDPEPHPVTPLTLTLQCRAGSVFFWKKYLMHLGQIILPPPSLTLVWRERLVRWWWPSGSSRCGEWPSEQLRT